MADVESLYFAAVWVVLEAGVDTGVGSSVDLKTVFRSSASGLWSNFSWSCMVANVTNYKAGGGQSSRNSDRSKIRRTACLADFSAVGWWEKRTKGDDRPNFRLFAGFACAVMSLGAARARLARTRLHLALSHVRAPRLRRPPRLVDPARWPFNCGACKHSLLAKAHSLQGVLAGFDQKSNIVLSNCTERVYSVEDGVEEVPLGLYLVKGETMCASMLLFGPAVTDTRTAVL